MNSACPRWVSLTTALGLPSIPSPTISAATGDCPAARRFGSPPIARFAGFVIRSQTRPPAPTESSSPVSVFRDLVTDWSFSFRCSPPRIAATQLRFDTARFFTAQKRTSTVLSPRLLRRTSASCLNPQRADSQTSAGIGRLPCCVLAGHQSPANPRGDSIRACCELRQLAFRERGHDVLTVATFLACFRVSANQ